MDVDLANGGRISDAWAAAHEWVRVPLEPGDVLVFGSHLAHRSAPNNTDTRRASLYATFHGRSDGEDLRQRYYAHRRKEFPPDHGMAPPFYSPLFACSIFFEDGEKGPRQNIERERES
jgi:hypothetical protein